MINNLLQIDVELLLCRYGLSRVLVALAASQGYSEKELQERLADLRVRREHKAIKPRNLSLLQRLQADLKNDPERFELLRPIAVGFDNGRVLPTLKSIHRFLESRGVSPLTVKSRKAAGPSLLRVLRAMSTHDLAELESSSDLAADDNDFALLSDAILKPDRRK